MGDNLAIHVESTVGIRGLSFAFALEACYFGYDHQLIYSGDSSPLYGFLPGAKISPEHARIKAKIID